MTLTQLIHGLSPVYDRVKTAAHRFYTATDIAPDVIVDGAESMGHSFAARMRQSDLDRVVNREVATATMDSLLHELINYTSVESEIVQSRIIFNESLKEDEVTAEFYDLEFASRPENNLSNWNRLATDLTQLKQAKESLRFDTVSRKFSLMGGGTAPETAELVARVNQQLEFANDISIVNDATHMKDALAGRTDYVGKKLAPAVVNDRVVKEDLIKYIGEGNFLVVGPNYVRLGGPSINQELQSYFGYFTTPTLEHLLAQRHKDLQQNKQAAVAYQIGVDTIRGNLRGAKNVALYVSTAYFLVNAAVLAAKQLDVDINPEVVKKINLATLVAASYIPSYTEVAEIAGGIDVEQVVRIKEARKKGREHGDLSLYRRLKSTVTSEQTFQKYQIFGWIIASLNTIYQAMAGNLDDPAIFAATMSAQVSSNNGLAGIAMWLNNHYAPRLRERRRAYVAQHPESIKYFGVEAVVNPDSKNEYEDLISLNPKILEHLPQDGANRLENILSAELIARREKISSEVNSEVVAYMERFNQFSKGRKQIEIMRLVVGDQMQSAYDSLSEKVKESIHKTRAKDGEDKVQKPSIGYRLKSIFVDGPMSVGLPIPLPYKKLRLPEGSFFNRAFPFYNVAVPIAFLGGFAVLGASGASPIDIVSNTQINTLMDAVYVAFAGIAAQGGYLAIGAGDTGVAALGASAEGNFEAGRRGRSHLLSEHRRAIYNAPSGKEGAVMYGIPLDKSFTRPYDQIDSLLKSVPSKSRKENVLEDTDESFVYKITLKNGLGRKTHLTAVRSHGEESFRLYSDKDLGQNFSRYRPAN